MAVRSLPAPLRELGRSAAAIPALIMVGVFVALGAAEGGYFETSFLPAALLALALLVMALVSVSTRAEVPRTVWLAVGLFGGYAAWSFISILWATDQGAAWEGANRALMYAVVFVLFALWPMRKWPATVIVGAFGIGVAGLGLVTLLRASAAGDVSDMFVYGRFVEPVGYTNGNVALWFSGFLPCLFLAARREVWPLLRGIALGGACVLAGLSLLGQSRGWLAALPIVLVVFFVIVPGRARNGLALVAVGAGVLAALGPTLDVFEGFGEGQALEPLIESAVRAILLSAAALTAAGAVAAFADRTVEVAPRSARLGRRVAGFGLAAGAIALVVALAIAAGDPIADASNAWEEFKAGSDAAEQPSGGSRFTSAAGQNRYDYWTVALSQFGEDPLTGAGAGNFQSAYLREGETVQRPLFPHSLEVRLLSETGLIGALLFLGGVVAAVVAGVRAIRARSELTAAAAGTAISVFAYWAVHGSVDWFYELPALAAPAFAMLGLAAGLMPRLHARERGGSSSGALVRVPVAIAALAIGAVAAGFALALPWLAQLQINDAIGTWEQDPAMAFDRLDRAAALNPLSIEPHTTGAAIALRLDLPDVAREEFEAVLARDPDDAYATLQLAALASQRGNSKEAMELLRRADELSPRDALIDDALAQARAADQLDPAAIYEAALERRSSLTTAP